MSDFTKWLFGLKDSPEWTSGGSWRVDLQSLPQGLWAVIWVTFAACAIAGVWYLYRHEGRTLSLPARMLMAALRCGILVCIALMLLELVLVITRHELVPSRLLVVFDTSESMDLTDPYTESDVANLTADRLGLKDESGAPDLAALRKSPRWQLAQRAVSDLLGSLADGRELSVYTFAGKTESIEDPKAEDVFKPKGAVTAVGDAMSSILSAHRGQPLAGVLLITDAQNNAGADPRSIAQQAGKEGIPINALAVGTEQGPSNVRLIEIEASPIVFVRDPAEVSVLVESSGMEGRQAAVILEQRIDGGTWTELGQEEIAFGQDAIVRRVTFRFTPENIGQYDFRARVSDVGPELTEADNVANRSVKVVRQKIRTLLIAGYPGNEVQFLRNALQRDVGVEFASWLQTAEQGYEHVGNRPLRRLPMNRQELEHYDVVILFDPDMRQLGPAWPELLTKFVGDAGGGLIYVAGELHAQALFNGGSEASDAPSTIDNSWLRILGVTVESGLYQSAVDVRISSRETWNLELTNDGANDQIFRFSPDPVKNREILTSLPGMFWHFPVSRAKPGATVLARHGDPRMANSFGRHALLVTQRYGPGRTAFLGFDSTFRWRYLHEEYFDGFWARLVDRMGRSKALGGRYPFTLATDKNMYRTGDRVTVRVEMISSADDAQPVSELHGDVEVPGHPSIPLQFEPSAEGADALEATFTASEPGAYTARVIPNATGEEDSAVRPATLNFAVQPPKQEIDQPTLNRPLLDDVCRAAGGQVFTLAEYSEIPEAFKVKRVERVLEYRDELWDAPILFGTMVLLLTTEWVWRKKFRMA